MSTDQPTYQQYKAMGYEKLHRELKKMLSQAKRIVTWFNTAERARLLPALQAMHDVVAQPGRREPNPSKPNWEDECRLLGISPELVRQWKYRTAAETDIRHLLGEEPNKPGKKMPTNAHAMKHLKELVFTVLKGDDVASEHLAATLAEYYKF